MSGPTGPGTSPFGGKKVPPPPMSPMSPIDRTNSGTTGNGHSSSRQVSGPGIIQSRQLSHESNISVHSSVARNNRSGKSESERAPTLTIGVSLDNLIKRDRTLSKGTDPDSPRNAMPSPRAMAQKEIGEKSPKRQEFRNAFISVLEFDKMLAAHENKVRTIVAGGLTKDSIPELQQIPMSSKLLERTSIGKLLKDNAEFLPRADALVAEWRAAVKRTISISYQVEEELFSKYATRDPVTNELHIALAAHGGLAGLTGVHSHSAPAAAQVAGNAVWKYVHDCRELLSVLRKDYNAETKMLLLAGELSPREFVGKFNLQPDAYNSPRVKRAREESAREEHGITSSSAAFPFLDKNMLCPKCGDTGLGCRYNVNYMEMWDTWRGDRPRTISLQCPKCGHEWTRDE